MIEGSRSEKIKRAGSDKRNNQRSEEIKIRGSKDQRENDQRIKIRKDQREKKRIKRGESKDQRRSG